MKEKNYCPLELLMKEEYHLPLELLMKEEYHLHLDLLIMNKDLVQTLSYLQHKETARELADATAAGALQQPQDRQLPLCGSGRVDLVAALGITTCSTPVL
ncbi:hypothetical protein FH972_014596 [Carpinus fangiana]|uniref:Uncharacterized protein n=1 Tax=Carpinus fangiana TaxID=176857 RepID=A0A5N6RA42_9ROSI|nr:hypothetical protein FH972_014596 [Carpinus fangiana]